MNILFVSHSNNVSGAAVSLRELIDNNNNGIMIADPNPLDFYKYIILLVNDSKYRKRITDKAFIYAERFKSSIVNKKFLNLYYKSL